jgi:hypothetical protein
MSPRIYVGANQVPRPICGFACYVCRMAQSRRLLRARHPYIAKLVSPLQEPGSVMLRHC